MSGPAILAPQAQKDLRAALRWIASDNPVAARGLRDTVDAAARLIGARPDIGRFRPELTSARYRFWSLTGFPYLLVYEASARPPRIARIVHTARDLPKVLAELNF